MPPLKNTSIARVSSSRKCKRICICAKEKRAESLRPFNIAPSCVEGNPYGSSSRLGLPRRRHTDKASPVALILELHIPLHQRKQGVILTLGHVFAGLVLRSALPHQNRTGIHQLPAKTLYSQPLSV